ncbi:helix-hairpin-helix domain-containing protein [bacterium]|nr:helix-hairpin-helix domain-containing protein [bacterium]
MKNALPVFISLLAGFGAGWFLKPDSAAAPAATPTAIARPTADSPAPPAVPGLVNINSASNEELQTIPGIGPVLAGRILEYRQSFGGFTSVDELTNVKGIGEKTLAKMLPHITV